MNAHSNAAVADHVVPADVADFCSQRGAVAHLNQALLLAENIFAPVAPIELELATDHETGDRRVIVQIIVCMTVDDALGRYEQLVRQWVSVTPPDTRYLFSFSYDFRDPQ